MVTDSIVPEGGAVILALSLRKLRLKGQVAFQGRVADRVSNGTQVCGVTKPTLRGENSANSFQSPAAMSLGIRLRCVKERTSIPKTPAPTHSSLLGTAFPHPHATDDRGFAF